MPKKQKPNNRLDKLFEQIKPEKAAADSPPKKPTEKPVRAPAPQIAPPEPAREIVEKAAPVQAVVEVPQPVATEVVTHPQTEGGVSLRDSAYSVNIQTGYSEWSTLRIFNEDEDREWTPDDEMLVKQVSDQLALALENARLFQEAQQRAKELDTLNEMALALSSETNIEQICELAYVFSGSLLNATNFFIALYEEKTGEVRFPIVINDGKRIKNPPRKIGSGGLTDHVIRNKETLFMPSNVLENMERMGIEFITVGNSSPALCWLGVPLLIANRAVGAIVVQSVTTSNLYTEQDRDLLLSVSGQVASALENARLLEETQERANELALINKIVSTLTGAENVKDALQAVVREIVETYPIARGAATILNEERQIITIIVDHSKRKDESVVGLEIPLENNHVTQTVIRTRKPYTIKNPGDSEENPKDARDTFRALGVTYTAVFPIIVNDKVFGTLGLDMDQPDASLTQRQIELLETALAPISTAISRLRAEEEARERANELGLINRIVSTLTGAQNLQQALELVVREIVEAYPIARAGIAMMNKDRKSLTLTVAHTKRDESSPIGLNIPIEGNGSTQAAINTRKPFVLNNPAEDPINPPELREAFRSLGITYTAIFPIIVNDEVTATLGVDMDEEGARLTQRQINLLESALAPISTAISRLRAEDDLRKSEEALRRRSEYLSVSSEIGKIVTSILDLNTVFSRTVNLITERFDFYHAGIFIVEETGFNAVLREATGAAGAEMKKNKHALPVNSNSIVGRVTSEGVPVVVNDVTLNPLHKINPRLPETRGEAAIPLKIGNRIIGAIDIQAKTVNAFTEDDIAVLQTLADQIAVSIDNARSYELSQQAVMEMRETDRVKSQFLANMSHELRTPLNSIIGFSRVILKGIDGPVTDLQKQDLTAIYNSGQHLLGLINDILDFSKIEAGKMELAFDEVNMGDITSSVLSTMSGYVKDKPVQLKSIIEPNLPTVRADTIRLRQVMLNLLSNAAKFTDEGDVLVRVSLETGETGRKEVQISVTDSGQGISKEDQNKLFQAFSQVDDSPTRKTGGTGLGLAICQELVRMHGGRIWVDSEVGKGSTFSFTLQLFHPLETVSADSKPKVILAIDDDLQVINLYERYLQPQGYALVALTNPARALERAKELKPFAITLDVMMPDIDGWQVLDILKGDPETRHIPVIVCSIVEDLEKGFSLGAADYLLKPILEDDLVNSLDRLNSDGSIRDVLVIDDDPNDLRLIGKILNDDGRYKSTLAEGGLPGWAMLSSGNPPHAVIIDLFMPDLNGFEILGRMRDDPKLRDIPTVIISGADLTPEQKDQLNQFGQGLVSKGSFSEKELLTTIQRTLERVHKNEK